MEYEWKQDQTWGSDSTWVGEIRKFYSPSLPVWSVLLITLVNKDQPWMSNMICLCKLAIVIPRLARLLRMAKDASSTAKLVNSVTSDSVNSFNFAMWDFARKCSPLSWSHVLMDGEELDDKQYIWCHGCRSPQFSSAKQITKNEQV